MAKNNLRQVFEHQCLRIEDGLAETELNALEAFYGSGKDFPYYKLINKGIKFCEYVGVIQVGNTIIEVLPKTDRESKPDKGKWQQILISMLRVVNDLDAQATGDSNLKLKPNSILEMYFEIFIKEVEYLFRTGLVRKYRSNDSNQYALKGRLIFSRQIQKNLVHQERFYTRNTIYDHEHVWHIILYQAISLIKILCCKASLHSRICQLELSFPEMPRMKVTADTFARLRFNRQTERYRKAIDIAKLLLLNYHPDIQSGRNNVLALMFDMNMLWEGFVFKSLRKQLGGKGDYSIRPQVRHEFWESGRLRSEIRPDIVIQSRDNSVTWIWDTKWKIPIDSKPSSGDLQQMFSYAGILNSERVALVYPGDSASVTGHFYYQSNAGTNVECSVIYIPINTIITKWQDSIGKIFTSWINSLQSK